MDIRKKWQHILIVTLTLVLMAVFPAMAQTQRPVFVPDELLVKFREGANPGRIETILNAANANLLRNFKLMKLLHVRVPAGILRKVKQHLQLLPEVEYVAYNYYRYFDFTPDDPGYTQMWALNNTGQTGGTVDADIDAPEAWDITTGHGDLVVAVIDSGIDLNHPDLAVNIWTNPGEIPSNGIDDDANGYVDDVNGWDFSSNDNNPSDDILACGGHGTHTSGTIGAVGDNGIGVTGVNWNVKIMPLKTAKRILFIFCGLEDADIIEAILYASANGARISNNSYGGGPYSQAVYDAIRASKHLYVAAAGNEGNNNDANPSYPASYDLDNIVSVAATDHNDNRASFSNYGVTSVDLSAPGVNIMSTLPGNVYDAYDGTSMAAPHVVGGAALLLAEDPTLTNNELKWRLMESVDVIGIPTVTGGRLNAYNALTLPPPIVTISVTPTSPTTVSPGDTISYTVTLENTTASDQSVMAAVVAINPVGIEIPLVRRSLMIGDGQILSQGFIKVIPFGITPGAYEIIGRVQVPGVSFDEDLVDYQIVP